MSGYGAREARIKGDRSPRVTVCGDCGCEVAAGDLLCSDCRTVYTGASAEHTRASKALGAGSTPAAPAK